MNRHIVNIYTLGVVACGGFGGITGVYKCLEEFDFVPNKRNNHQCTDMGCELTDYIMFSTCCVCGFLVGSFTGTIAGVFFPVIVPVYGLVKIRNRYASDNEIKE
jgi:hypothetical protein